MKTTLFSGAFLLAAAGNVLAAGDGFHSASLILLIGANVLVSLILLFVLGILAGACREKLRRRPVRIRAGKAPRRAGRSTGKGPDRGLAGR